MQREDFDEHELLTNIKHKHTNLKGVIKFFWCHYEN